jgi:hypothetical protein
VDGEKTVYFDILSQPLHVEKGMEMKEKTKEKFHVSAPAK